MTDDRTTLKSTLRPDRDQLHVEASNPVSGSVFLELDAQWRTTHVDANELRAAIDKAVGPADSPEPQSVRITNEMVERALVVNADLRPETVRRMLTAALTEPPARPEGAERWEDFLIDSLDYQALTDQQITDLADRIAEEMNR